MDAKVDLIAKMRTYIKAISILYRPDIKTKNRFLTPNASKTGKVYGQNKIILSSESKLFDQ
ncbi:MAG: hypothetical protein CSA25_01340 [Desulfobacter postgatei]|uniref:Uncharacterized protein n=1 Tax=Desulfobacter postgatei TaxID=2293 RepID=A0A2G6MSZ8_9BACT|nr:MAG: hypothetical protein CSA25_01340 [Desulfobacter postgatei]